MLVKERGVERALDDESARLIKEVKQLVTQRASVQEWVGLSAAPSPQKKHAEITRQGAFSVSGCPRTSGGVGHAALHERALVVQFECRHSGLSRCH